MEQLMNTLIDSAAKVGLNLLYALIALIVGLRIVAWIIKLLRKSKGMEKLDSSVKSFILSFISISLKCIVFLIVIHLLGIPMTSVITLFASAGLAIGLALQGALGNFAGGLMILIFHPFKVGDYIDTHTDAGTVMDINVFYTVLRTPDNKHITLPNGTLTNASIINYSAEPTRRVEAAFSVAYGSDIEAVKEAVLKAVSAHTLVLKDPEPFVRLSRQNESSLDFVCRTWCNSEDYWTVHFDLNELIKRTLDENKIQIPFPQLDVHIKES